MMNILIVDDNNDLVISLASISEVEGYHVTQANNGEQAINIAQDTIFDLVLMDLKYWNPGFTSSAIGTDISRL